MVTKRLQHMVYAWHHKYTGPRITISRERIFSVQGSWIQPSFHRGSKQENLLFRIKLCFVIKGSKQITYDYLGHRWGSESLWKSRYSWPPMAMDKKRGRWHSNGTTCSALRAAAVSKLLSKILCTKAVMPMPVVMQGSNTITSPQAGTS